MNRIIKRLFFSPSDIYESIINKLSNEAKSGDIGNSILLKKFCFNYFSPEHKGGGFCELRHSFQGG
jgi:hypothetical protein